MKYEIKGPLGSSEECEVNREFDSESEADAFLDGLNTAIGWMEMDVQKQSVIYATIGLPEVWKELITTELSSLKQASDHNTAVNIDDPGLYLDDYRVVQHRISHGLYIDAVLASGYASYYGFFRVHAEPDSPFHYMDGHTSPSLYHFDNQHVLEVDDVKVVLKIDWL